MKRLSGLAYFYILIILFLAVMIVSAVPMKFLTSKLLPLVIAVPLLIVAVIGFAREVMRHGKPESGTEMVTDESEGEKAPEQLGLKSYLPISGWMLGFAAGIYILGFVITIPLFIVAYMKTHGMRWLTSIITAAVTTVFIWTIFELVLYIELYRGLLLNALGL